MGLAALEGDAVALLREARYAVLVDGDARLDTGVAANAALEVRVGASIAEIERRLILATLDQLAGDKKRAAEVLGISLKTLYNRLNVYAAGSRQESGEPSS